jgi:hypothetical protein
VRGMVVTRSTQRGCWLACRSRAAHWRSLCN